MSELKAGGTHTFTVGDYQLVVEPIPYGNMKKIIRIIMDVVEKTNKAGDNTVLSIPVLFETYLDQFVPLLFKPSKHPFLNKEWIDNNLTIPDMREIVEAAIAVNGLGDFFGKSKATKANGETPSMTIPPIPPGNSGSTISSASLTDGVREMSTP